MKTSIDRWSFLICLAGFFFWSCLLTFKYIGFGFYDWDLSLYAQAMQSLCRGTTWASLFGTSFLADHSHYIAFLLTPIYFLFPHPLTLVNCEIFSLFFGAYIFYKIAAKAIGQKSGLVLMLIYIFHPANIFMLFYEFHFESLCVGLIFLMFYFWDEKRFIPFILTVFVLMLIKENMALIVAAFGVYGTLVGKEGRSRWGAIAFIIGAVFFFANLYYFIPFFRRDLPHTSNIYWGLYSQFGGSLQAVLYNICFHPLMVFKKLYIPGNLKYFSDLLSPFLFLPLFGLRFFVSLPILAQNLLANNWGMHTIYYHYAATLVPFAALGTIETIAFIKKYVNRRIYAVMLALMIACAAINAGRYIPVWHAKINRWFCVLNPVRQAMIDNIPKGASVVTSFIFLNHLTDHKDLYAFYNVWKDVDYFTFQSPFKIPDNVQYALIDFNDPWLLADLRLQPDFTKTRLHNFFIQNKWILVQKYGKIFLYEKHP